MSNKIANGLRSAIAYAKGDKSKGRLSHHDPLDTFLIAFAEYGEHLEKQSHDRIAETMLRQKYDRLKAENAALKADREIAANALHAIRFHAGRLPPGIDAMQKIANMADDACTKLEIGL